jgi:hypothetical protein
MRVVRVALLVLALMAWPLASRADILVVPFFGGTFSGKAMVPLFGVTPPEPRNLTKSMAIGVSGIWLTRGVLGAEAELAHFPRFFELGPSITATIPSAFDRSSITSFSGNVIIAAPLSMTRESLRPYLVGGLGVLHSSLRSSLSDTAANLPLGFDRDIVALNLGGGAIGMLGEHTGLRFDIRRTRSLRDVPAPTSLTPLVDSTGIRLSYWRVTVGVIFRY